MTGPQLFLLGICLGISIGTLIVLLGVNARVSKMARDLKWRGVL